MTNQWVTHVKEFSKKHNIAYGCAVSNAKCKEEYKNKKMTKEPMKKQITKNAEQKISKRDYVQEYKDLINNKNKFTHHEFKRRTHALQPYITNWEFFKNKLSYNF